MLYRMAMLLMLVTHNHPNFCIFVAYHIFVMG